MDGSLLSAADEESKLPSSGHKRGSWSAFPFITDLAQSVASFCCKTQIYLARSPIVLNARNLLARNKTALLAVPWLGMFTGLLGNLSLLSYFAKKKEKEAVVVQTLGVISIYVVIAQLAMAEAMPLPHFIATSIVVASGLALNFLNYFDLLSAAIWRFWEDFITVVMWSTFVPYIPNSILPGITAFFLAVAAVVMRIRIEGIKNDPWFRKNYVAVEHGGDEDVNLDNVHTVFDDIEV